MERAKWLVEGDRERNIEDLNHLKDYWQHQLGLCEFGITVEMSKEKWDGNATPGFDDRVWKVQASNERVLLHELLHILLGKMACVRGGTYAPSSGVGHFVVFSSQNEKDTHAVIFQLSNVLLRLKYGELK